MVAEPAGSWVLPLDVARRGPHAGTATDLAIVQLRAVLAEVPDEAPRPVVVMDSHDGLGPLIAAALPCDLLARLPARRNLYRRPGPRQTRFGAPRKHGALLQLHDPQTLGTPDRTTTIADPQRDWVRIDVWDHLHERATPTREVSVIRVTVGRLPRRADPPDPLWLVWHGDTDPQDLTQWWRWDEARFTIEHLFRFLKQELGWTRVQVNDAATADRWSSVVLAASWELWLARAERAAVRLPWERPLVQLGTPGQVRRGFAALLPGLGTPARPPRCRGKSPGRQRGDRPGPRPRHPVHKRGSPSSA